MREESHLDDMRQAIRGDFERLAERRGGQELMRPQDGDSDEDPDAASTSAEPRLDEPVSEPLPEPEAPPEDDQPEDALEEEPRRRSWVDRLLGR